jgi:hypothetical protein
VGYDPNVLLTLVAETRETMLEMPHREYLALQQNGGDRKSEGFKAEQIDN